MLQFERFAVPIAQMASGDSALHVRRARQCRRTDDIADCINVWMDCLEVIVDFDLSAMVGRNVDCFQAKVFCIARSSVRPQQHVALQLLTRLQMYKHMVIECFYVIESFVVPDADAGISHVIAECVTDFVV